jgi:hypothetical protein
MEKAKTVSKFAGFILVVFLTVWFYHVWQFWLSHATGSYNTPGSPHNYNAFSGSLSDVGEYTIAGGMWGNVVMLWRIHTCHRYWWCWRHGHHQLEGTPYKLCNRHHPDDVPSVEQAVADYKAAA